MDVFFCVIFGYSGGKVKDLCDILVYFVVDDMQIVEDMQVIVGYMVMQWLYENKFVVE